MIKATDEFREKTASINQLWRTDFTYLKVVGWAWMYLSTTLDDYSRYIIAWKLRTTIKTSDATDTLGLALQASGCDWARVIHKPRLLSDNGSGYVSGELAEWLGDKKMGHYIIRKHRGVPIRLKNSARAATFSAIAHSPNRSTCLGLPERIVHPRTL